MQKVIVVTSDCISRYGLLLAFMARSFSTYMGWWRAKHVERSRRCHCWRKKVHQLNDTQFDIYGEREQWKEPVAWGRAYVGIPTSSDTKRFGEGLRPRAVQVLGCLVDTSIFISFLDIVVAYWWLNHYTPRSGLTVQILGCMNESTRNKANTSSPRSKVSSPHFRTTQQYGSGFNVWTIEAVKMFRYFDISPISNIGHPRNTIPYNARHLTITTEDQKVVCTRVNNNTDFGRARWVSFGFTAVSNNLTRWDVQGGLPFLQGGRVITI